ncbi:hypothetical protein [Symbiobacterium thermophilum]|uniref:hypothetical protein n=1 Tax=Symbiobacterium thermophilum TaxID=2734 RepID=UPI0035C75A81
MSLAYGAGRFVACADGGLSASTDGLTWTPVPLDARYWHIDLSCTGKEFVATGCITSRTCEVILTSADGVSRYQRVGLAAFDQVAYGNGRYVVSFGNAAWTWSSADLTNWTTVNTLLFLALTFDQGMFVAADADEGTIRTSADGVEWTEVFHPDQPVYISDLAYGGGRFVAVGGTNSGPRRAVVLTSGDGRQWSLQVQEEAEGLVRVVYGAGRFVANSEAALAVSEDGTGCRVQVLRGDEVRARRI